MTKKSIADLLRKLADLLDPPKQELLGGGGPGGGTPPR
jgi:hypothetical protein